VLSWHDSLWYDTVMLLCRHLGQEPVGSKGGSVMAWLSLLIHGFKIASAIADIFAAIQRKREFIEQHNLMNEAARVEALTAIRVLENDIRTLSEPLALRARFDRSISEIEKRVLGAAPGTRVEDVLGVGKAH